MRRVFFAVAFAAAAASLRAQPACPARPANIRGVQLRQVCDPCLAGQPATLTLVPDNRICYVEPLQCSGPYEIQACDKVVWNFGDNSDPTTVIGSPTVTHTYATGGAYRINVEVTNASAPTANRREFYALIGRNPPTLLTIDAPTSVSETGGAIVVRLTRSGNLGAPTSLAYRLSRIGGQALPAKPADGQMTFAPGESEKTLSFPLIDDNVFLGKSTYSFSVESGDGTLLSGLPADAFNPFARSGTIEVFEDDRRPHLRVHALAVKEGNAGFNAVLLTATLDGPMGRTVGFVAVIPNDGGDFYTTPYGYAQLSFLPGQTTAQNYILIKGDIDPEPDETFPLSIGDVSANEGPLVDEVGPLTILNDDIGFGAARAWVDVGQSITLPVDLGNALPEGTTVTFTPDTANLISVTSSLRTGSSGGTVTITGLRGGDTVLTATAGAAWSGSIHITVFQPSTLVAEPAALRLYVGDEKTLRVSFDPAQPTSQQVIVQTQGDGIVAVLDSPADAPPGGVAEFRLRALAAGSTSLILFSPGQRQSTIVPVEVLPSPARRRAVR